MTRHDLAQRRVWITGASSGIGRAMAQEFARRGSRLALSGRNEAALAEVVQACGGSPRALAVPFDVTDRRANHAAVETISRELGGLDIAVFNAGTCEYLDVRHFDSGIFERTFQINVISMAYGIEAALPLLRASPHPHLVGMSSTVAYGGLPRAEAYGASKAAIRWMLESLRIDLMPERIFVSVICPGFVRTPLTDRNDFAMPALLEPEDAARRIVDGIERCRAEIHFPKRFSVPFKLLALLPTGLYSRLVSRLLRQSP